MRWALIALWAGGGCDLVFGSDFTSDAGGGIDAPKPIRVTGSLIRRYVSDSATGPVIHVVPYGATELAPEVFIEGAPGTIQWNFANGSYFFDGTLEGQRYRIVARRAPQLEIQSRRPVIDLASTQLVRPGAVNVFDPPTIAGKLDQSIDGRTTYFMTTGAEWRQDVIDPDDEGTYALVWPGRHYVSASAGDRAFFAQYELSPSYSYIARAAAVAVELAPGVNAASATLVPQKLVWCADLDAPQTALESAVQTAYPDFREQPLGWVVSAMPDATVSHNSAFTLAEQFDQRADAITVEYSDPFETFDHVAVARGYRIRELQNGPVSILGQAYAFEFAKIEPRECPTPAAVPFASTPLPIPSNPRIGSTFITTDGAEVSANGATELVLAWDGAGADLYTVVVYDVTGRAALDDVVLVVRSTEPEAVLDMAALATGNQYVAIIAVERGFTGAADGDFTRQAHPFSATGATTAVFTLLP